MDIKKKLQIVEIMFKNLDGEELEEAHIEAAIESLVADPLKRARYRQNMLKKYGQDIFKQRAAAMQQAVKNKSPEWRKERASKAGSAKKGQA